MDHVSPEFMASSVAVTVQTVSEVGRLSYSTSSPFGPVPEGLRKPPPRTLVPVGQVAVAVLVSVLFTAVLIPPWVTQPPTAGGAGGPMGPRAPLGPLSPG